MSTSIPGRGKPRKNGHDLNTHPNTMGGAGQTVMPPNGAAAFTTPLVNQGCHAPEQLAYNRVAAGHTVEVLPQPSGIQGSTMILPQGMKAQQQEQPSHFAINPPTNNMMRSSGGPGNQWAMQPPQQQMMMQPQMQQQQPPSHYAQQQQMAQMGGMPMQHMATRGYPPQPQQHQPYYQTAYTGYPQQQQYGGPEQQMQQAPPPQNMYYTPQQQQQYHYQQQQQAYMMIQHQQQQQQQQQGGGGAPPPHMGGMQQQPHGGPQQQHPMAAQQQHQQQPLQQQMPVAPQQQQHQGGMPPQQQQQPVHPHAAAAPHVPGGPPAAVGATIMPNGGGVGLVQQQQPQHMQPQPPMPRASAAPFVPKKKNVLAIVNPDTQEMVNLTAIEAIKKKEEEEAAAAKLAVQDEAKGSDEADGAATAAPDAIKKQFAAQILEQTTMTKSEQPAPVPTPAAPVQAKPQSNKCLFSLDQLKDLHLPVPAAILEKPVVVVPVVPAAEVVSEPTPPVVAAAAAPSPIKQEEKPQQQPAKNVRETTPKKVEMHDSDLDRTQDEEKHVSSSSEKNNTSNDSAICVDPPSVTTSPQELKAAAVVKKAEVVETAEVEEPAPAPAEEKKEEEQKKKKHATPEPFVMPTVESTLEHLVIPESLSAEEEEGEASEPVTPAPVTPSASETAVLVEEEEDAEKAAAAAEEERQAKRLELEAAIAENEKDKDQCNVSLGRYNREYLYNVREYEKLFQVTACPLKPAELLGYGICRSQARDDGSSKKKDGAGGFMPSWGRGTGGGGGGSARGDRKAYQGRQSEQHHNRAVPGGAGGAGGGAGRGSNKKMPPHVRPSIERRVDTNVQLHKAEQAWKPEKTPEDIESDEAKKKLLLKNVRALFNKITPTTKDALIDEFLSYKVYESETLNDVISVIFDKAVEEPKFCPLYSSICISQVQEELKHTQNVSKFRNAILYRAQDTFTTKTLEEFVAEKKAQIDAEEDERKKREKQIELMEAQNKFRRRKFGNITFIGQLYLQSLLSIRIIHFCIVDLLKSVSKKADSDEKEEPDEESVDCAVRLLETIGRRLHEEQIKASNEARAAAAAAANPPKGPQRGPPPPKPQQQQSFPLDLTFTTLEAAAPSMSSRIKFMILNLVELRRNGWVPRKTADAGPKKLDEIKNDMKKEQIENAHAAAQYDRKQSRQENMGGGGGGGNRGYMGGGGGGGGGGPNPKRQIIARNSQDRGTAEERRSQAVKSSNLATRNALPPKKASLSSVTSSVNERGSLGGGGKAKWSGGASGGSENSKKEDRAAVMQQTSRFLANAGGARSSSSASMKGAEGEEGAGAASGSGTATQVNSEDEREQNELRMKQEADLIKKCLGSVEDYGTAEITFDESRDEILGFVGDAKLGTPSVAAVFKCLIAASLKKARSAEAKAKYGHVLAACLLKKADDKRAREEALRGVADFCRSVVDLEMWEDSPKIWEDVAEVLIRAHLPADGLVEGAHASLVDFKDAFLHAAKDERKPYALFVHVLKRAVELHHARDSAHYRDVCSWILGECDPITKSMNEQKLHKVLKETTLEFADGLSLFSVIRSE